MFEQTFRNIDDVLLQQSAFPFPDTIDLQETLLDAA
jgi:hypothetical protein